MKKLLLLLLLLLTLILGACSSNNEEASSSQEEESAEVTNEKKGSGGILRSGDSSTELSPEAADKINSQGGNVSENNSKNEPPKKEEKGVNVLYSEVKQFPVTVLSATAVPGDPTYVYTNPPLLILTTSNGSSDDIKVIRYGVLTWDENGLPSKPNLMYLYSDKDYQLIFRDEDIKLPSGGVTDSDFGYRIDPNEELSNYAKVVAVVISYEDFDGNLVMNHAALDFLDAAAGKKYQLNE